jgi:glucan biosynthesis protein
MVLDTRVGQGGDPGGERSSELRRVVIEFGPPGPAFTPGALPEVVLECHNGECSPAVLRPNETTGGWQVAFDAEPGEGAVELRCHLLQEGKVVSETWLYRLDNS